MIRKKALIGQDSFENLYVNGAFLGVRGTREHANLFSGNKGTFANILREQNLF